jgi:hypothetical protein
MKVTLPIPSVGLPEAPSFFISREVPRVRIPFLSLLLEPRSLNKWLLIWAYCFYLALCVGAYFYWELPRLKNEPSVRLGADSPTYWEAAQYRDEHAYHSNLISFTSNYLGPVTIAEICRNGLGVVIFNMLLFFLSVELACTIPGVDRYWLVFLLVICPETLPALSTLNKEILVLVSALLLAKYVYAKRRSWVLLGLVLLASLFARWEQIAIILAFLFLRRKGSFGDRKPYLGLASMIAALTIIYPVIMRLPGSHIGAFTQYTKGANTIAKLDNIQNNFGFPLVIVPKIILDICGELLRPLTYLSEFDVYGIGDVHKMFIIPLFSISLIVLLVLAYRRGMLNPHRPIAFLIIIYLIMTSITPFVQPRYNYFVYVLLALEFAKKETPDEEKRKPTAPVKNVPDIADLNRNPECLGF